MEPWLDDGDLRLYHAVPSRVRLTAYPPLMDASDHPDAHQLAGAAAREAAARDALAGHDWRRSAKILYLAWLAGDFHVLGHSSRGAYYESLGVSADHGHRLRLVGEYWWAECEPHEFREERFEDALAVARRWKRVPNGLAA